MVPSYARASPHDFKEMRCRHVPVAKLGGFVVIEPGMHARFDFQQRGAEIEIDGSVVHRIIAAEHKKQFHFPGVDVVH